jgi:hypothetical protein
MVAFSAAFNTENSLGPIYHEAARPWWHDKAVAYMLDNVGRGPVSYEAAVRAVRGW